LGWEAALDAVHDGRVQAQIPTGTVVRAAIVMILCRLGSLNAVGQTRDRPFWRKWLGQTLPSPDTMARVACLVDVPSLRAVGHQAYDRLKRNKVLTPPAHGLVALVLDGHETHATYKRHCPACLERVIHTANGDRVQHYHRLVTASLMTAGMELPLDAEPIGPGEDEVAVALRLLDRLIQEYPRSFDVVQGDALYADPRFFNWALDHGKHALAVLKNDRRDLLGDAQRLFEDQRPRRECWDLEGFTTWPQVHVPVRVVRSHETRQVRRQLDKRIEEPTSDWYWVTTLPAKLASTGAVVQMGHRRWGIENEGFNELVNQYHADHVYRHEPTALLVFWLLTQLCLSVFVAFFRRNLKPAARAAMSMLHVARLMLAELLGPPIRAPT